MSTLTSAPAAAVPAPAMAAKQTANRALVAIGAYKVVKALLFFAAAFGVIKLLHKDTGVELAKVVHVLRISGDRAFVKDMLLKANVIDDPKKKIIGGLLVLYGVLFGLEGIGLLMRKRWGEWFSVIVTSTGIPYELYEIFHRTVHKATTGVVNLVPEEQRPAFVFNQFFFLKVAVLIGNVAIVWFLINHIRRSARQQKVLDQPGPAAPAPADARADGGGVADAGPTPP